MQTDYLIKRVNSVKHPLIDRLTEALKKQIFLLMAVPLRGEVKAVPSRKKKNFFLTFFPDGEAIKL